MNVLALAGYDSFLNTARLIAPHFEQQGVKVEFGVVKARSTKQITPEQIAEMEISNPLHHVDLKQLCSGNEIEKFDIVLSCLEGLSSRRLFYYLAEHGENRPFVISVYPGLLLRYAFDGYAMRAPADQLWLNCRRDVADYTAMCDAFGVDPSNVRLFGNASLLEKIERDQNADANGPIVFFEQAVIPKFYDERIHILRELCALARRYPDREFLIKARLSGKKTSLHRTWHPVDSLLEDLAKDGFEIPDNISLTQESTPTLLSTAGFCLTVSSTVAVEALHAGIPTAIIADIGAHDEYGLQYFYGSGLLRSIQQVDLDAPPQPDPTWIDSHTQNPNEVIEDLVKECIALAGQTPANYAERNVCLASAPFQNFLLQSGPDHFLSQRYKRKRSILETFKSRALKMLQRS